MLFELKARYPLQYNAIGHEISKTSPLRKNCSAKKALWANTYSLRHIQKIYIKNLQLAENWINHEAGPGAGEGGSIRSENFLFFIFTSSLQNIDITPPDSTFISRFRNIGFPTKFRSTIFFSQNYYIKHFRRNFFREIEKIFANFRDFYCAEHRNPCTSSKLLFPSPKEFYGLEEDRKR